jgi:hypothetical protein
MPAAPSRFRALARVRLSAASVIATGATTVFRFHDACAERADRPKSQTHLSTHPAVGLQVNLTLADE